MTTYLYEVTFKVGDSFDFERIRASSKVDAAIQVGKLREKLGQCISIMSVTVFGN